MVSPSPVPGPGVEASYGPLVALVLVILALWLLHWIFIGRHRGRRPGSDDWN